MKTIKLITYSLIITLLTLSCQKTQVSTLKPVDIKAKFDINITPYNTNVAQAKQKQDTLNKCNIVEKYNLPLPYKILNPELLGDPVLSQLFPPDSADYFINITQKSFFLGVYLSDLVYTIIYDQRTRFFDYYNTVLDLSRDLGIKQTFTETYLKKFQESYQQDSIKKIINDAIVKTCRFLDESNQISILPFMLIGSWAESMYLIIGNAIYNQDIPFEVYQIIAQQPQTIEKFEAYIDNSMLDLESFTLSADLLDLKTQLDSINNVYQRVYISDNISIAPQDLKILYNAYNSLKSYFANK